MRGARGPVAAALAVALGLCRGAPGAAAEAGAAPGVSVTVTAAGVRAAQGGRLLILLFRGEATWLRVADAAATLSVPADAESVTAVFAAVPPDTAYAVEVIHDRNGNGRLDMRILPYPRPKEGAGVSGNRARAGRPRFAPARFAVADSAVVLRIVMRY